MRGDPAHGRHFRAAEKKTKIIAVMWSCVIAVRVTHTVCIRKKQGGYGQCRRRGKEPVMQDVWFSPGEPMKKRVASYGLAQIDSFLSI
jgi:hypothetical protein